MNDYGQSSSITQVLRDIWADILDIDPADINDEDSFFELGGNSVTAADLVAKAQVNGLLLSAKQIYLNASLAKLVGEVQTIESSTTVPEIEPFSLLTGLGSEQTSQQSLALQSHAHGSSGYLPILSNASRTIRNLSLAQR